MTFFIEIVRDFIVRKALEKFFLQGQCHIQVAPDVMNNVMNNDVMNNVIINGA